MNRNQNKQYHNFERIELRATVFLKWTDFSRTLWMLSYFAHPIGLKEFLVFFSWFWIFFWIFFYFLGCWWRRWGNNNTEAAFTRYKTRFETRFDDIIVFTLCKVFSEFLKEVRTFLKKLVIYSMSIEVVFDLT